jgi:hypothetical protein
MVAADALADHRLHYLDYEGPVAGNRGTVRQWDAGTFEWLRDTSHELAVTLRGRRLVGQVTLVRSTDPPDRWSCSFAAVDPTRSE